MVRAARRLRGNEMARACSRRSGRRQDEGTALIEAALVLPVVLIIVFGIIELGLLFRSASVTTSATRTGARLASAQYGNSPGATTANEIRDAVATDLSALQAWAEPSELWVYKAVSNGEPAGGTCGADCMRFTWTGSGFSSASGSWPSPDACGANIDRVGVRIFVQHDSLTGVAPSRSVRQTTVMRLEPKPFGVCTGE